jgi:hypothetical protein
MMYSIQFDVFSSKFQLALTMPWHFATGVQKTLAYNHSTLCYYIAEIIIFHAPSFYGQDRRQM